MDQEDRTPADKALTVEWRWTVAELIKALQNFPPSAKVVLSAWGEMSYVAHAYIEGDEVILERSWKD